MGNIDIAQIAKRLASFKPSWMFCSVSELVSREDFEEQLKIVSDGITVDAATKKQIAELITQSGKKFEH